MSKQITLVFASLILSCGQRDATPAPGVDAGPSDATPAPVVDAGPGDVGGCACVPDNTGAISSSWDCYCGANGTSCARDLNQASIQSDARFCHAIAEYPTCGLTVVFEAIGSLNGTPITRNVSVFDTITRQLIGVSYGSDVGTLCPVVPLGLSSGGSAFYSGEFPPADCPATSCAFAGDCGYAGFLCTLDKKAPWFLASP